MGAFVVYVYSIQQNSFIEKLFIILNSEIYVKDPQYTDFDIFGASQSFLLAGFLERKSGVWFVNITFHDSSTGFSLMDSAPNDSPVFEKEFIPAQTDGAAIVFKDCSDFDTPQIECDLVLAHSYGRLYLR